MREIIFLVENDPEGGYIAKAIGEMIRDAVHCHFDDQLFLSPQDY